MHWQPWDVVFFLYVCHSQLPPIQRSGSWDSLMHAHIYLLYIAVDCGTLTNPANGQVTYTAGTLFGQTATYSCDSGYNLVGESVCTCQATGVWSGSVPTCQGTYLRY